MSDEDLETRIKAQKYQGNSKLRKEEPTKEVKEEKVKLESVVSGKVVKRKKSFLSRVADRFTGGDDATSVFSYVIEEIAIPALQSLIVDMVSNGAERLFIGETRSRRRGYGDRDRIRSNYVSYGDYSKRDSRDREPRDRDRVERARRTRGSETPEILLESRGEAEDVLDRLRDQIERYDEAKKSDLYDLLGEDSDYTDDRWGWKDLRDARVSRVVGGLFLIDLPRPEALGD